MRCLLLLPVLAAAGCTVGPEYRAPPAVALGVPGAWSVGDRSAQAASLSRWWTGFGDPVLAELVERSTANLDVGIAVARLVQARETLIQNRATRYPQLSASAAYSRNEPLRGGTRNVTLPDGTVTSVSSGAANSFSIGADASYQLDLFGGVTRSIQAARGQYEASRFDYASVLLSVQAEIANSYLTARLTQAQLANARASLAIQDENLEIADFRVQAGLVSSLDVEQARTQRAQTAATIPQLDASYASAVARLGVLTGQAPGALRPLLERASPIPRGPAQVGVGIPADALRQRPDVRSAERSLAAATAQIGVATAQLYPALGIGGSIDASSTVLGDILDVISGRLFANVAQTIFDGGQRRSQVRASQAAADAAFLTYKQSVLLALEDVENAVVARNSAREREAQFAEALDAASNFALLSRSQYRAGLTDFTTLNQAEASLLSARNGLSQAQADSAGALVQLFTALGGGWDEAALPDGRTGPLPDAKPYTSARQGS